jgi:16S rRNA (uracil1498-N3)-methyltransferase
LRPGEQVEISDGKHAFLAQVKKAGAGQVELEVLGKLPVAAQPFPVILQVALFKFPRLEWLIEKATELGAASIVPVEATLSDRGLVHAAAKRRERWERIAEEAAQQSRRLAAPPVESAVSFDQAVATAQGPLRFLLDRDGELLKNSSALHQAGADSACRAYLLVGPEGGWTPAEREHAIAAGYQIAALGATILRAETAAAAALAILTHLLPQRSEPNC